VADKKTPKKEERRKTPAAGRKRPARGPWVDLVVPPSPFACSAPSTWTKEVYVWDLDRTYLRTEFESLRDLIRTALQKAKDKVAYPGASALMRALRDGPDAEKRPVYFISASPPQIRRVVIEKFALDRVEVDGVYFKDNIRNVRPSRLRRLREQVGYKLLALLDLRMRLPTGAVLNCFGDDYESDALIYSLFGELCGRWIKGTQLIEFLVKQGVFKDEAVRIAWRARRLPASKGVGRIFIHMHGDQDPRYYRRFGSRVIANRNYFQTAAVCWADGKISMDGLVSVGAEMLEAKAANAYDLAGGLMELIERRVLTEEQVGALATPLIAKKILPAGFP
jgi:hypothetical protein